MTALSPLAAFDLLARGGVCVLLLLVAALLLRDYRRVIAAQLGALFAVGSAAYAMCSASGLHEAFGVWAMPVMAMSSGNNLVFWLFARALFDDGFRPKLWHAGLWLVIVAVALAWGAGLVPGDGLRRLLALQAFLFAVLAAAAALTNRRDDLVEPRRRFRLFVVLAAAGHMLVTAAAGFLARGPAPLAANTGEGFVLLAIAAAVTWSLLAIGGDGQLFAPAADAARAPRPDGADPVLVARLERAMIQERLYRREGLTIGQLATAQGLPEHRLRRLINQGLGYRNFNAFLNRYRIDEAKAALADPAQAAVPVLTIALDAGFTSLGPFNRAFRERTGTTPTAFRRAALAEKPAPIPVSASRISKSA